MKRNGYEDTEGSQAGRMATESDFDAEDGGKYRMLTNCPPGDECVVERAMSHEDMQDRDDEKYHRKVGGG